MSDCEIVYKIEFDGIITRDEYKNLDKAMEAAQIYFANNHHIKEAKFFKCTRIFVNMMMVNKHYEESM